MWIDEADTPTAMRHVMRDHINQTVAHWYTYDSFESYPHVEREIPKLIFADSALWMFKIRRCMFDPFPHRILECRYVACRENLDIPLGGYGVWN
jgi:hypothetical protein